MEDCVARSPLRTIGVSSEKALPCLLALKIRARVYVNSELAARRVGSQLTLEYRILRVSILQAH